MRAVILAGTGRIGKRLVRRLEKLGVKAIPASPSVGGDAVTGTGLQAVTAADTVLQW
jgi:phosphoglycerate dehydrogenase-like enzyme